MKRYSIAPSSARRNSTAIHNSLEINDYTERQSATLELEKLEQEITLTLQEIDKNLSKSNMVINDKIFPIIRNYANSSENVWSNVNFWKYFFEQAANAEIASYESPAMSNELNTFTNTQKNILLLDNDDDNEDFNKAADNNDVFNEGADINDQYGDPNRHYDDNKLDKKFTGDNITKEGEKFRRPLIRGNIEELTPTWSTGQPNKPKKDHFVSSTPQFGHSALNTIREKISNKYDSTDSLSLQRSPMRHRSPMKNDNQVMTYTLRQSLDNYQKISISPGKSRHLRTPLRADETRRRSSMIQDLMSSPTLPEPPVLLSEIGGQKEGDENQGNLDRLSPIMLSPQPDAGNDDELQRFPRTPQFERPGSSNLRRTSNIARTPIEIREQYRQEVDESDIKPPEPTIIPHTNPVGESQSGSLGKQGSNEKYGKKRSREDDDEDEDAVPFPDLETIELRQKVAEFSKRKKLDKDDNALTSENPEDNVFLDNEKSSNNSIVSTIYHSIVHQQQQQQQKHQGQDQDQQESNSKDNTANQSNSRSISNLFENVLEDLNKGDNEANNQNKNQEDNNQEDNNSSNDLGLMLNERFKQFLNK